MLINIINGLEITFIILSVLLFIQAKTTKESATIEREPNPLQKKYITFGDIQLGDLVSLFPYWAKQGIVDLILSENTIVLRKKSELQLDVSAEQHTLFQILFAKKEHVTLGTVSPDLLCDLRSVKSTLLCIFDQKNHRAFTKISMRNKTILQFLLFFSILIHSYVILKEIKEYSPNMETVTFLSGVIGISFAIFFSVLTTIKHLQKGPLYNRFLHVFSFPLLLIQYFFLFVITWFVSIRLKSFLFTTILACTAYLCITLLLLFITKRTETFIDTSKYQKNIDYLYEETKNLYDNPVMCQQVYSRLQNIKLIWDDAEKVKIPGNDIPVSYS